MTWLHACGLGYSACGPRFMLNSLYADVATVSIYGSVCCIYSQDVCWPKKRTCGNTEGWPMLVQTCECQPEYVQTCKFRLGYVQTCERWPANMSRHRPVNADHHMYCTPYRLVNADLHMYTVQTCECWPGYVHGTDLWTLTCIRTLYRPVNAYLHMLTVQTCERLPAYVHCTDLWTLTIICAQCYTLHRPVYADLDISRTLYRVDLWTLTCICTLYRSVNEDLDICTSWIHCMLT